jgi:uncharacterized protein (DUF1697 family)
MNTYIVLLRGINVGGNNILPMKQLVVLLEKNKFQNVRTYIQSGNIVLESEMPPENIGSLIETQFGFKPDILILDKQEFLKAVNNNPFQTTIGNHLHFNFCKQKPDADIVKIEESKTTTEEYSIIDKVVYFYAPDGIGRSKLAAKMEKFLGVSVTARNLNTVNKLVEMIAAAK